MPLKRDLVIAPVGEGALILVLAAIGWAAGWPFVFASLGPTTYKLVEKPESKPARPYNVVVGHLVELGAGFFALWIRDSWTSPKAMSSGLVPGSPNLDGCACGGIDDSGHSDHPGNRARFRCEKPARVALRHADGSGRNGYSDSRADPCSHRRAPAAQPIEGSAEPPAIRLIR